MFKTRTEGNQPRTLRGIAEEKNPPAGFEGPTMANYDHQGGASRDAKDVSKGTYEEMDTFVAKTPSPSKSIKSPIK